MKKHAQPKEQELLELSEDYRIGYAAGWGAALDAVKRELEIARRRKAAAATKPRKRQ